MVNLSHFLLPVLRCLKRFKINQKEDGDGQSKKGLGNRNDAGSNLTNASW